MRSMDVSTKPLMCQIYPLLLGACCSYSTNDAQRHHLVHLQRCVNLRQAPPDETDAECTYHIVSY